MRQKNGIVSAFVEAGWIAAGAAFCYPCAAFRPAVHLLRLVGFLHVGEGRPGRDLSPMAGRRAVSSRTEPLGERSRVRLPCDRRRHAVSTDIERHWVAVGLLRGSSLPPGFSVGDRRRAGGAGFRRPRSVRSCRRLAPSDGVHRPRGCPDTGDHVPFFAAFIMPDIFTGLSIVAAGLLLLFFDRLPTSRDGPWRHSSRMPWVPTIRTVC